MTFKSVIRKLFWTKTLAGIDIDLEQSATCVEGDLSPFFSKSIQESKTKLSDIMGTAEFGYVMSRHTGESL